MPEVVLHHYPQSPVSEKVRVVLGIKDLEWASVEIPRLPPKPDLMPLTGGYRLTPVMQIGADVYCDSQCIIRALERRFPHPTLFAGGNEGLAWGLSRWTDGPLFTTAIRVVFGDAVDQMPAEFVADRAALYFGPDFDAEATKAALPENLAKLAVQFDWLESQFTNDREYVMGPLVRLADALCYYLVWFVRGRYSKGAEFLDRFPRLSAWETRMQEIGHGRPSEMSPAQALDLARSAEPEEAALTDFADPRGLAPGDSVTVTPEIDGGSVDGVIARITSQEIVVLRADAAVGDVAGHFPQGGDRIRRRSPTGRSNRPRSGAPARRSARPPRSTRRGGGDGPVARANRRARGAAPRPRPLFSRRRHPATRRPIRFRSGRTIHRAPSTGPRKRCVANETVSLSIIH